MISKLCLGTVQLGLDYGIANTRGKIPKPEIFEIFKYAQNIGLDTLDTSMAYGESESTIGEFIATTETSFQIVSKILVDSDFSPTMVRQKLQDSLQRLTVKPLYGYLVHRFEDFVQHPQLWNILESLKREGLIKKIGFSLYRPEELDLIWDRGVRFDIVQVPFSVLDRRFEKYFRRLKEENVEIYARSVFLQGLVFLKPDQLPQKLTHASESIQALQELSQKHNLSINAICLNYVLGNRFIDKTVIGVDGLGHFRKNIDDLKAFNKVGSLKKDLENLAISNEDVLLPFKWN